MKNLLEKALVHFLNGDNDKADALFHKFVVERARECHESLRQDEDLDMGNWDDGDEIKEEEYFDDDDMGSDDVDGEEKFAGDENDDFGEDMDVDGEEEDEFDFEPDSEEDDFDGDDDGMTDTSEFKDKLDDIEAQIHELTAEFDRLMGSSDEDEMSDGEDLDDDDLETENNAEDDFDEVEDENSDLADRMGSDMDDEEEGEDYADDDEHLDDITESVLAELDRIASPGNTDGKEIGNGGTIKGNKNSPILSHGVDDRMKQAKPIKIVSKNDDSFAREPSPKVAGVDTLVRGAKNSMPRSTGRQTRVPRDGDSSAALNSDFAAGRKPTESPIDGKKAKK